MASLNKVMLIGNLTRQPELKYTPGGSAITTMPLAINRRFKDANGALKEEVTFVDVVAFSRQAEACAEYLRKGSPVFIEGRLHFRKWETPDGQSRSKLDVTAERVQFLHRRSDSGEKPAKAREGDAAHPGTSAASSSDPDDGLPPDDGVPF